MSRISVESITIYEAMNYIENGKYVMPAFQRQYVWSLEQIEKLWDSILSDYPIATFLFWNINDDNINWDTYFCQFLKRAYFNSRKIADTTSFDLTRINLDITDTAILDGQQRLTSLFLSLCGEILIRQKHARKKKGEGSTAKLYIELNKNTISLDEGEYNSKNHDIKFYDKYQDNTSTMFEVRKIMDDNFREISTRMESIEEAIEYVPSDSKDYAKNLLNNLCKKVHDEKIINYTFIEDMQQDDALEMFIRFNSGGKALKKSEITMSILEAYWPSSKKIFSEVLTGQYEHFSNDFIIRTALMIFGDVKKPSMSKSVAEDLKNNWNDFKKSLKNLEKLFEYWNVDLTRYNDNWNILIPMIYVIYGNPRYFDNEKAMFAYMTRAIFFIYYRSGTTGKLQKLKSAINNNNFEISEGLLNDISELAVTEAKLQEVLDTEKGKNVAEEFLYFISRGWVNKNFKYEQDHLHPYSKFDINNKPVNVSSEDWLKWRVYRNRLANLHLLEGRSNGSKNDMRLVDYYNDMNVSQQEEFKKNALIPDNVSLDIDFFGEFYTTRRNLLYDKLKELTSC